jgi:hypothetical protein
MNGIVHVFFGSENYLSGGGEDDGWLCSLKRIKI